MLRYLLHNRSTYIAILSKKWLHKCVCVGLQTIEDNTINFKNRFFNSSQGVPKLMLLMSLGPHKRTTDVLHASFCMYVRAVVLPVGSISCYGSRLICITSNVLVPQQKINYTSKSGGKNRNT